MIPPHPETTGFRVPSAYLRCRRKRCHQPPVADACRQIILRREGHEGRRVPSWWAYCADHLREYNREIRGGIVWWRGDAEWHDRRLRSQLPPDQAALWPHEEAPNVVP
jgi:hypothetical protein